MVYPPQRCLFNCILTSKFVFQAPHRLREDQAWRGGLVQPLCDSQVSRRDDHQAEHLPLLLLPGEIHQAMEDASLQSVEPGGADRLLRWRPVQRSLCLRPLPRPLPPAGAGHLLVLADSPQTVDRCFKLYDVHVLTSLDWKIPSCICICICKLNESRSFCTLHNCTNVDIYEVSVCCTT